MHRHIGSHMRMHNPKKKKSPKKKKTPVKKKQMMAESAPPTSVVRSLKDWLGF